ncbi:MAG: hypothetical protein ACREXO_16060, partial [Advenella sp.]
MAGGAGSVAEGAGTAAEGADSTAGEAGAAAVDGVDVAAGGFDSPQPTINPATMPVKRIYRALMTTGYSYQLPSVFHAQSSTHIDT